VIDGIGKMHRISRTYFPLTDRKRPTLCGITPDVTDIECLAFGQEVFFFSEFYKKFTKSAQSSGPENIGPERPLPSNFAP